MFDDKTKAEELTLDEALKLLRGSGKPLGFVDMAVEIASSVQIVEELLRWTKGESKFKHQLPPPPPVRTWLSMYHKHREIADVLFATMSGATDISASELLNDARSVQSLSHEERLEQVESMSREEQEAIALPFVGVPFPPDDATLRMAFAELEADADADHDQLDEMLNTPQGQYYFRVWIPCWMMYREFPPRLLRQARLGNMKSLDKLLRLDKTIVHDPKIADHVHRLTHTGSKRERDFILQAIEGRPKVKLDAKSIKYGLSGMISQFAMLFHCKVTASEITKLFDGIERVRSGHLCDTDLPGGDAFSKAVSRNRNWTSLPRQYP